MDNSCAILVLGCDKNISVLNIFFDFFKKFWPECKYPIYLGLEKSTVRYDGVSTLNSNEKQWAKRIKSYLMSLKEERVLIILDDFIPEAPVDFHKIETYIAYMKENQNIATISLAEIYDKANFPSAYPGLMRRKSRGDYLLNMQVGLWNKSILCALLRDKETPWETELFGSIRARKYAKYQFLCIPSDQNSPYRYGRGWLLVRGCWNGNEIKRLGLESYYKDIFDGKDIIYKGFMQISFVQRVIRRLRIIYRKMLSRGGVYI